jgi:hypothetical protein
LSLFAELETVGVVAEVCREMGWQTAARRRRADVLPISRSEYLALDAMAFAPLSAGWPFPVAVFELENSRKDDKELGVLPWH